MYHRVNCSAAAKKLENGAQLATLPSHLPPAKSSSSCGERWADGRQSAMFPPTTNQPAPGVPERASVHISAEGLFPCAGLSVVAAACSDTVQHQPNAGSRVGGPPTRQWLASAAEAVGPVSAPLTLSHSLIVDHTRSPLVLRRACANAHHLSRQPASYRSRRLILFLFLSQLTPARWLSSSPRGLRSPVTPRQLCTLSSTAPTPIMAQMGLNGGDLTFDFDSRGQPYFRGQAWSVPVYQASSSSQRAELRRNVSPIQTTAHDLAQSTLADHHMMSDWRFQHPEPPLEFPQTQHPAELHYHGSYGVPLQASPVDLIPMTQGPMPTDLQIDNPYLPMAQAMSQVPYNWEEFQSELVNYSTADAGLSMSYQQHSSSPTGSHLEVRSLTSSGSNDGWSMVEPRHSLDFAEQGFVVNPSQTLHNRALSESSYSDFEQHPHSSLAGFEVVPHAMHSPDSDSNPDFEYLNMSPHHRLSIDHGSASSTAVSPNVLVRSIPVPIKKSTSPIRSPGSQGSSSSPGRRGSRKSPIAKATEKTIKKAPQSAKPETEKRVGRRKGPLRPDQRKQASEIRKLRACLRCKFLKKTCDKGEPCAGCQPSHARLWQVPCTRVDIKEIGYFMRDWNADYARHVTLGFSVGNIKGFSDCERTLWITHGYGEMIPVKAREVYVRDDKVFGVDWVETLNKPPTKYEVSTAKLSAGLEGVSTTLLSDYLDRHIDGPGSFERFVDDYFEGTPFLSQMLKTAYSYWARTQFAVIKKALKLILAYCLTVSVTMVEGVPEEEGLIGKIEDETSKFYGKTMAPVMINFQIKQAMADMWRELQKDVLEELSALYSSVYSGDRLKNWPTIFILATVLLAVWECMQFDCHYRTPDPAAVDKFCSDMETTPVGVIVGLFQAISQKLPSFLDWDTAKHHHILGSNPEICKTLTEVREHVTRYGKQAIAWIPRPCSRVSAEPYLRDRSNAKFDRQNFDCLSNKFLARLVIRAN